MTDLESIEKGLQEALMYVESQVLHQWRFMNDEIYRIEYFEFLDECGLSMQMLEDEKLLIIPVAGGIEGVVYRDKSVSPDMQNGSQRE